ncbi:MAG: acyl-[acyl-carrier-protein] thioesterase [Muribaculaceae bacterium]
MKQTKEYSETFFLAPGECDPQQRMPLSLLTMRLIQVATYHANQWGVGYETLIKERQTWVLSRVAIEMKRYPMVNETYTLTTWIEGYNRRFSERNFAILDAEGNEIGYARTIWVIMNIDTRESTDMTKFAFINENISDRPCPIERHTKLRQLTDYRTKQYSFDYSDIDFNRHVNSCKYIEHILNQWTLDFHDAHTIRRFEIAYMKEAVYGEEVEINTDDSSLDCKCDISHDGAPLCRARILFEQNI